MVPLLLLSASTSLLLTIPLITVFFPVACSLTSASMEKHWHGFSHTLATDIRSYRWAAQPLVNNHASLVFHRAACSGRCSSRPRLHLADRSRCPRIRCQSSVITHTLMNDDTQLYVEMADGGSLDRLSCCISCFQHWFLLNHLLLNGSKSEAINHWDCSTSRSVAAAIRDECRRELCRSQRESEAPGRDV